MTSLNRELTETLPTETEVAAVINDALKKKGWNLKKVSELTGIALKHLESLAAGNPDNFPPAPYLRSYLLHLGEVLNFNGQVLWERLRQDELTIEAGKKDLLPQNRFVRPSLTKFVIAGIILVILITYLVFRLPSILGQPKLYVFSPAENVTSTDSSPYLLQGKLGGGDQVFINGEQISLDPSRFWSKNIVLENGLNTIELVGKKFLGRETKIIRQLIYNPGTSTLSLTTTTPTSTLVSTTTPPSLEE